MSQPVEIGLILSLTVRGLFIGDYGKMLAAALEAERMGFHSLWQCDHFFSVNPKAYAQISGKGDPGADTGSGDDGPVTIPLLDSWVAISALARDTKTIRLGHLVRHLALAGVKGMGDGRGAEAGDLGVGFHAELADRAAMPELGDDGRAGGVDFINDALPTREAGLAIEAGDIGIT